MTDGIDNCGKIYQSLMDGSDDALAIFSEDIEYIYANLKWKELFNLPDKIPIGAKFEKKYFKFDSSPIERAITLALAGKPTLDTVQELRSSDGLLTINLSAISTNSDSSKQVAVKINLPHVSQNRMGKACSILLEYLNLAESIFVQLDKSLGIELINEAGSTLLGKKCDELIGRDWIKTAVSEDYRETCLHMFKELFEGNISALRTIEYPVISSDNSENTIQWKHSLLKDSKGNTVSILANGINITPAKKTENRLKDSEERFKALAESIDDILLSVNHSRHIIYWNPVSQNLSGISSNDAEGKELEKVVPEFADQGLVEPLMQTIKASKTHHLIKDVTFDNIVYTMDISFFPNRQGATILARNISSQIRFQEQIFEQAQILDQLSEAVITTNSKGTIVTANNPCSEIFNKEMFEILGTNVTSLFTQQSQGRIQSIFENLSEENDFASDEFKIKTGTDATFPALVHISIKKSIKNEATGFILSIIDISETAAIRQEMLLLNTNLEKTVSIRTRELEEAKQQAEIATRAKTDFLANMSHEVRTPMNTIVGLNQMLENSNLTAKQRKYTQQINESSNQLLKIINSILDYSRLESGTASFDYHDFSMANLLQQLKTKIIEMVGSKKITPLFIISPSFPATIHSDPGRFQQVIEILIDNAVKFTESGEIILAASDTRISDSETELRISIQDTGIGIGEEMNQQVFTPFTQADTSKTRKYSGAGIGLALCRQIVSKMGGNITFRSTPGIGTTFTITLKIKKNNSTAQKQNLTDLPQKPILVLESREQYIDSITAILSASDTNADYFTDFGSITDKNYKVLITNMETITTSYSIIKERFISKNLPVICYKAFSQYIPAKFTHGIYYLNLPILQSDLLPLLNRVLSGNTVVSPSNNSIAENSIENISGTKILIVDDNKINSEILTELLTTHGLKAETVFNGFEALKKLETEIFDIVLLDIKMPLMNGFETIEKIRNEKKLFSLPVLALSADTSPSDVETYLKKGFNGYVKKPFDLNTIFKTLSKWINPGDNQITFTDSHQNNNPLKSIDGINIRKLINKINPSPDKLIEIYKMFYTNNHDKIDKLKALHRNKNREELITECHNLLSVSGNIEATDLYNAVKKYKISLCNEDYSKLNFLFADLCFQLDRVLNSIKNYLKPDKESVKISEKGKGKPLPQEIEQLKTYLDNSDTRALVYIDELLKNRYEPTIKVLLSNIKNYCLKFDFDTAVEYVNRNTVIFAGEADG
ncbi:MAG TPA: ATP-binding protein [Spirochaetota bacterium]|nr:ATP-binding protein [Spirochaetota bacterium]